MVLTNRNRSEFLFLFGHQENAGVSMKLWSQYVSRKSAENQIKNYEHELTVLKSANKCRHGRNQRTYVDRKHCYLYRAVQLREYFNMLLL